MGCPGGPPAPPSHTPPHFVYFCPSSLSFPQYTICPVAPLVCSVGSCSWACVSCPFFIQLARVRHFSRCHFLQKSSLILKAGFAFSSQFLGFLVLPLITASIPTLFHNPQETDISSSASPLGFLHAHSEHRVDAQLKSSLNECLLGPSPVILLGFLVSFPFACFVNNDHQGQPMATPTCGNSRSV